MTHALNCKFCHKPIHVEAGPEFMALGYGLSEKLLAMACCNHCGDLRERRRVLSDRIRRAANTYLAIHNPSAAAKENARKSLTCLCKRYAEMIAEWHGKDGSCWDEAVVETILESPNQWGEVLGRLWTMYRQWAKEQEAVML